MKNREQQNLGQSAYFAFLLLFARFMKNRIPRSGLRMKSLRASGRFSSWLARTDWCAKLPQNGGHDPTDLSWSHRTPLGLPRQQSSESERAGQIQLEERQRDDPTPALKLSGSPHVNLSPEQILFQKTEEMLLGKPQAIALWHLLQRHHLIQGQKPTHARITLGITCPGPLDPDHREHQLASLLEMHFIPAADSCPSACLISFFPHRSRVKLGLWPRPLQQRTIFGRCASRVDAPRFTVELAIAFQADQHAVPQLLTGSQHLWSPIPAISDHDDPPRAKEWFEPPKLFNRHPNLRLITANVLEIQRRGPTAGLFGQQPHHRKHPSVTSGFVSQRQVRDVNVATALAGLGLRALHWGCIDSHPDIGIGWQIGQDMADTQRSQLVELHLPIGQRRINTGPLPLEKGRVCEFGQRAGLRLAQQSVTQAKQGIGSAFHAAVDLLTKRFQCVKVHLESAPLACCLAWNSTPSGNLLQVEMA